MSHLVTGVEAFDDVTVPDDGEAAVATAPGVPASRVTLEEVVQELANRDEWLRASLHGSVKGRPVVRIAESASVIAVGAVEDLILGRDRLSLAASTVSLGTLPADVWRYLYAWNDGGALEYEISATAPSAGLVWRSGGTTHRYLAAFRTTLLGLVVPFSNIRGSARQLHRVMTSGTASSWTELILDDALGSVDAVPPFATRVHLRIEVAGSARLRRVGYAAEVQFDEADSSVQFATFDIDRNGGGRPVLEYQVVGGGSTLGVEVLGWEE